MSFEFFEYNGSRIHYERRGEGTAVTLIHAGIVNLHMWDEQMDAFATNHHTLRYDVRGWGKTVRPNVDFSHHEDLRALLKHVGIEKTAVVGCSWGGKIAIDFALTYPEMVSALVLVGPGLGGYEWTFADFAEKAETMETAYEKGDFAAAAELETQIWFDGPGRTAAQTNVEARQCACELVLHTFKLPEGEGSWQELEPPAIERLADIQVPVQIIVGQYDVPDIHTICELLEDRLPLAEERTIMWNTAHLPNMERPSKFNQLVLGFLAKLAWQSDIYAILPHVEEAKVWLEQDGEAYTLPHLTMPGGLWDTTEAKVQRPLRHQLGQHIQVLYRAHFQQDEEAQTTASVFVLDNLGAELGNGRWVDSETLLKISLKHPEYKQLIQTSLHEWETGVVPKLRPPWARRGWFSQAETWFKSELQQYGHTVSAPLEVVRNWGLSFVMRAKTSGGDFYFKTVANIPLFVNEATLVSKLAQLFPQHILTPTAIHAAQDWMILPALPQILGWGEAVEQRAGFMRQFVRLQQTAVAHTNELLAAGMIDRRPGWMQTMLEPLFTAELSQQNLTAEERSELSHLIPFLRQLLVKLADGPIPQTLVHGDLHGGNVGILAGEYVYYDWTDACLSHPFFDMVDIFYERDTAVQTQLRDVYLAEWSDLAPMTQLLEIWTLAEVGAAIHHAISYWQILINIEPHAWEDLGKMLPFWLRKILTLSKQLKEKIKQ